MGQGYGHTTHSSMSILTTSSCELRDFCAQPALAGQRIGLAESGALVRGKIEALGGAGRVRARRRTARPRSWANSGPARAPCCIYNHYDVQPPEPLDLWHSPPYAGAIRDGKFYARGVADDKGDLLARVQAIRAYQATHGPLPLRLRWLIEGEEEIGSPHLAPVTRAHADSCRPTSAPGRAAGGTRHDTPSVVCGMKGMLYVELHATGANHDVHSGAGGIVPNPAWRLVQALHIMARPRTASPSTAWTTLVVPPERRRRWPPPTPCPLTRRQLRRLYGLDHWQRGLSGHDVLLTQMFEPTAQHRRLHQRLQRPRPQDHRAQHGRGQDGLPPGAQPDPGRMVDLLRAHLDRRGFTDVEIGAWAGCSRQARPWTARWCRRRRRSGSNWAWRRRTSSPMTGGSGPFAAIAPTWASPR